jgi:hypothetical protein
MRLFASKLLHLVNLNFLLLIVTNTVDLVHKGFQILFDCADGFSGLSCSALTYIQDEYSRKSVFAFPNMPSTYPEDKSNERCRRVLNTALSLGELPELSSAFVPLCTDTNGGLDCESPRQFDNLHYDVSEVKA